MKRLHLHINVGDLDRSVAFYTALFGVPPTVLKADYAKWQIEDPRVNLAISQRGRDAGLDHLGIQCEDPGELGEVAGRLRQAGSAVVAQEQADCCYAVSDKAWTADPNGLAWETFHSTGELTRYGDDKIATAELARMADADRTAAKRGETSGCCGA